MSITISGGNTLMYVNVIIDAWSILFCLIALIVLYAGTKLKHMRRKNFSAMLICQIAALTSNLCGLLSKGHMDPVGSIIVRTSNFGEFFFSLLLSFLFSLYIINCIISSGKKTKRDMRFWLSAIIFILAFSEVMVIVTQFTGAFYYIDSESIYHRGDLFWLSHIPVFVNFCIDTYLVINYRDYIRNKEIAAISSYIIIVVAASVIQLCYYGIYFTLLATTASAIIMLIFIVTDQINQYVENEKKLTDMQSAIMLSQIQPHFVQNTLTSIAQLCEKDPAKAKTATINFSEYLRGNMNSLKEKGPVPFERELEHLENYVSLEKMRFGDLIDVEYDIETTDFTLPVLSVQPIVENAIKHGIGMKENGGKVIVSVKNLPSEIEISVRDNGVGFDPNVPPNDNKIHIGIKNVRSRIKAMCGGSVKIQSQPGQGTNVIICLPKSQELEEETK